jgi:hypothetical protein
MSAAHRTFLGLPELPLAHIHLPAAGDTLRGIRAIEVLERIGTPAARQLLQKWAEQVSDIHLATEARLAAGRQAVR